MFKRLLNKKLVAAIASTIVAGLLLASGVSAPVSSAGGKVAGEAAVQLCGEACE